VHAPQVPPPLLLDELPVSAVLPLSSSPPLLLPPELLAPELLPPLLLFPELEAPLLELLLPPPS
jgi:hypothetical protein